MNINRRITSITITTRKRNVLYKRTPSDVANHNCVVPAAVRAPLAQCCGPVPVKKPATKKALKVNRRSLTNTSWLGLRCPAGGTTCLVQSVLSRLRETVTCLTCSDADAVSEVFPSCCGAVKSHHVYLQRIALYT